MSELLSEPRFNAALAAIRRDPANFGAQATALALAGKAGEQSPVALALWLAATGFGNLDNVAALLPEYFFDDEELYTLSVFSAVLALHCGDGDQALRLFANAQRPPDQVPIAPAEVKAEYHGSAAIYDDNAVHQDSVSRFWRFLAPHLEGRTDLDIIDAPCGTGLVGSLLRPRARTLTGIDLSPAMLDLAAGRNCYDRLLPGDLVATLDGLAADLLICLGALYYFDDLAPVVRAAARVLGPGGLFTFTDYPAPSGTMVTIAGNRRYCRGGDLVRGLAQDAGFHEISSCLQLSFGIPCVFWLFRKV